MYIYAETAFHHEGDKRFIKNLISAIAKTDCQGVKFQVLPTASDFMSTKHSAYDAIASYCFNLSAWAEIFAFTKEQNLDIILMPLSIEALALADQFDVKYIDIHSVSFNDHRLLKKISERHEDIILGIGGRTDDEIEKFKTRFGNRLKVLMLGFQSFPSQLEHIRMGRIAKLKKLNPQLQIGYADHSAFDSPDAIRANEYALLLGATFFEKHVTLFEGLKRIDYDSAIGINTFSQMIERLKFLEQNVLLTTNESMHESEETYRQRQASVVATKKISSGEVLDENNTTLKMIDQKSKFHLLNEVWGKVAAEEVEADMPVRFISGQNK